MKHFVRIFAVFLAVTVAGCAGTTLGNLYQSVTTSKVSPEAIVLAASTFDALEVTATNYLRARRCTGTNGPICRDPAVTPTVIQYVHSGREARNQLKAFLRAHPGELGDAGLYDALTAANSTLQNVLAVFKANS